MIAYWLNITDAFSDTGDKVEVAERDSESVET
jgi:hypothetical protein